MVIVRVAAIENHGITYEKDQPVYPSVISIATISCDSKKNWATIFAPLFLTEETQSKTER